MLWLAPPRAAPFTVVHAVTLDQPDQAAQLIARAAARVTRHRWRWSGGGVWGQRTRATPARAWNGSTSS